MLDPGHHVQMCNLAFERLFRYGRDELMRANLKDLITTNDLTAVLLVNNRHTILVAHPLYSIHGRRNSRRDVAEIARLPLAHGV